MNLYKVAFQDNVAVSANQLITRYSDDVKIEVIDGKCRLKWMTLFAYNEQQSISVANKVVKGFFDYMSAS